MNECELVIELKVLTDKPLSLIVEPWGNEYDLHLNDIVRIGFKGRELKTIPIDHQPDCIVVEGAEGVESTGIWINGVLVG
jgi:LEA14-like dessication related protein